MVEVEETGPTQRTVRKSRLDHESTDSITHSGPYVVLPMLTSTHSRWYTMLSQNQPSVLSEASVSTCRASESPMTRAANGAPVVFLVLAAAFSHKPAARALVPARLGAPLRRVCDAKGVLIMCKRRHLWMHIRDISEHSFAANHTFRTQPKPLQARVTIGPVSRPLWPAPNATLERATASARVRACTITGGMLRPCRGASHRPTVHCSVCSERQAAPRACARSAAGAGGGVGARDRGCVGIIVLHRILLHRSPTLRAAGRIGLEPVHRLLHTEVRTEVSEGTGMPVGAGSRWMYAERVPTIRCVSRKDGRRLR